MRDVHNNIKTVRVLSPIVLTTTLGAAPKIVDLQGYQGCEFVIDVGAVTTTTATLTPIVLDGDVTGTLASVADAGLLGTEALAAVAAGARTSGTTKNLVKRLGYIGGKRYVTCRLMPASSTSWVAGVTAVLTRPNLAPVAT